MTQLDKSPGSSRRWLVLLAGALGIGVAAYLIARSVQDHNRADTNLVAVIATEERFTLVDDDGGNLLMIDRQRHPDIYYRVVLRNAPLGEKLTLTCDWIDPNQQIVHQNHYDTHPIDKSVWPTHAHYQFGPASAAGTWTVRMSLGGQPLCTSSLIVKDQPASAPGVGP